MTGRELLEALKKLDDYANIDIPVCISQLKLDIRGVHFDTSTDGKVPYINIDVKEELKIIFDDII